MNETTSIDKLQRLVRDGVGVVIGPSLTLNSGHEQFLIKLLKDYAKTESVYSGNSDFMAYSDNLVAENHLSSEQIREITLKHFSQASSISPDISKVVPAHIKAVVSLTIDDHFKSRYAEFIESKPLGRNLVTITHKNSSVSVSDIPYYALLGDINDRREEYRSTCFRAEYIRKRANWSQIMSSLPDCLQGSPLLILGFTEHEERISDFISSLLQLGAKYPRRIILLKDDPILKVPSISNLLKQDFELIVLDATLREIGQDLSKSSLSITSLPLWNQIKENIPIKSLAEIDGVMAYIPNAADLAPNPEARNRLLDSLFRPSYLDWSPYCLEMAFERECVSDLYNNISNLENNKLFRIVGAAGVGKTVTVRLVAFRLSQVEENICFWIRKSHGVTSNQKILDSIDILDRDLKSSNTNVYIFLDDPMGSGVQEDALFNKLRHSKLKWRLITCQCASDISAHSANLADFIIPDSFSQNEKESFAEYLCELEIAESKEDAKRMLRAEGTRYAKDVLCNLWYALPQTKAVLESSVSGEYDRLANVEGYIDAFVNAGGTESKERSIARRAYEMVTVCSGFGNIGLPVEVLVNSLEISYEEWAQLCVEGKPIWGLIYDEECPDISSWVYLTRNDVVTRIMLKHLNKDSASHVAEFRILLKLISAANSGREPYRTFIHDVLITNRSNIESKFSLDQAMELYDTALEVFPRKFGSLEHHRSLCKKNMGGNSLEVYDELEGLLSRSYEEDDIDSPENIHTSAAAAMYQSWKDNLITAKEASDHIFRHTAGALNIAPHSLHAIHTQANALLKMASRSLGEEKSAAMQSVNRAAYLAERSLMSLPEDPSTEKDVKDWKLFSELRNEYLAVYPDKDSARTELFKAYEDTKDQLFLAMIARMDLGLAISQNKGRLFKKSEATLDTIFQKISAEGDTVLDDILICRVQLNYYWRIRNQSAPVYWEQFGEDLASIRSNKRYKGDPIWDFLFAVAKFHLGEYPVAEQVFSHLRSKQFEAKFRSLTRCYYMGNGSTPARLEGTISEGAKGQLYMYCASLGTDMKVRSGAFRRNKDEIKVFNIEFSIQGSLAVPID